ncbi:hypothetical protein FZEAL_9877 [Fusarium zealandicum]|uniref:AB hydrolase-1 domain-containing protein n=1 Tax=Fusarium zealandicum TaxID=1053134 RepID=A0A8H4XDP8_9HYPO|nr:hypothetical protein FZEAL_9877 [Fusarium zealandicum]
MKPAVFIVPGSYEGPKVFEPLADALRRRGFTTAHITSLKSTGTKPPDNPTLDDDIAAVAQDLSSVVDRAGEQGVIAVMHSVGGVIGSAALEGLGCSARKAAGKVGGVRKIVFIAASVFQQGMEPGLLPFMVVNEAEGTHTCRDPLTMLFHDIPADEAKAWARQLQPQPATGWAKPVKYCGWMDVPSVYILCEQDRLLPESLQEARAAAAGSDIVRLVGAGHMAQLSQTEEVARIISMQAE